MKERKDKEMSGAMGELMVGSLYGGGREGILYNITESAQMSG